MGRKGEEVAAQGSHIDRQLAAGLDRVAEQERAVLMGEPGRLCDRLDCPRLVVGQHQRHQSRLRGCLERRGEVVQPDHPVRPGRDLGERQSQRPGRPQHGIMLDSGDDQAGTARLIAEQPEREVVRLGPAGGEDHPARLGAHQSGHLLPRPFGQQPGGAAESVHRGGIARLRQRRQHGLPGLGPQRRRRVVVEINRPVGHDRS